MSNLVYIQYIPYYSKETNDVSKEKTKKMFNWTDN